MADQVLVFIETPGDGLIHAAGTSITFQCRTVPAGFEDKVTWLVPETQYASKAVGKGKIFTTTFSDTGVKQVIAAGPSGEYTEVEIDRRLVDPIPADPRQEPEREEEEGYGGTVLRPVPDPPVEEPPPIEVVIETVVQTKPDLDDIILYVFKETTDCESGDILDSDPPPDDHRRRFQRSPKRGGHSESW